MLECLTYFHDAQAESDGVVWCMDRVTFRSIIVASTVEKRRRYEQCLASMPLFAALSPDQRAVIADCLCLETFQVLSDVCPQLLSGVLSSVVYICCN